MTTTTPLDYIKKPFIKQQIPGFVREEYPLFTEFIQQYYDFLDQSVGKIVAVKIIENGENYNPISSWVSSTTFPKQSRISSGGNVYLVVNTGITSSSPPIHVTGTVSNGSIGLTYVGVGFPTSVSVSFKVRDPLSSSQHINDPRTGSNAAAAYAILESGSVTKIVVTQYGTGYTEEDQVQAIISGGGGSGAVLEAVTTTKLGNINSAVSQTLYSRDIDQAIPEFIDLLRKELISDFPVKLFREDNTVDYNEVDVTKFIKFIKQFYKSKGSEKSIQFLFRILFNSDVSIYYPKVDMLRVSDGKWTVDRVIRIRPSVPNISIETFRKLYLGERILGVTSGVTAIIQDADVIAIAGGGTVIELKLTDINGSFEPSGENFKIFKLDSSTQIEEIGSIKACISKLVIQNGGIGYQIGDQIITDNSFLAKVKTVGLLGTIVDYTIENFGFDYTTEPSTFITTGGSGAVLRGTLGILLTYPGYYIGTDGQPSSSKRIQDSEYYQDFSYEIVSDQSANIFGQFLNRTIHPAGLKLFSKILSVQTESLYDDRLNFNPSYDNYTYVVANDETERRDFDISSVVDNGTLWLADVTVAVGLRLFIRIGSDDYIFEVVGGGILGNTAPALIDGNQTNGTAIVIFRGVAEQPLSVYLNGSLKLLNIDYIIFDANTIRFNYFLKAGDVVRIMVRPDNLFRTDYNEYIKTYTTIQLKKLESLRSPLFITMWYPGLTATPLTWLPTNTYSVNEIIKEQENYYLVIAAAAASSSGLSGTKPPRFQDRSSHSNGELTLKLFNYHRGYIGDIIYHLSNFYKVIGVTTQSEISGIYGQSAPTHTSGIVVNGLLRLEYHDPGFSFWEASKVVVVGDVLYYNDHLYLVTKSGTLGVTPPNGSSLGSFSDGSAVLINKNFNYIANTTVKYVSELDPGKSLLGPTVNDITRNSYLEIPQFFQDIPGTQAVVPTTVMTEFDLGEVGLSREDDEYIHYTIIFTLSNGTSAGTRLVRSVIDYTGLTKTVTLDSSITIPSDCTTVQYRLLQNHRIGAYDAGTKKIGISPNDLVYQLNALIKTQFQFDASTDVETTIDAIYLVDHKLKLYDRLTYFSNGGSLIPGITSGTTYFIKAVNDSYIRLYRTLFDVDSSNYIELNSGGSGQQFLYVQNNLYNNFSMIITSGPGIDNVLKIKEYNEIDNTVTVDVLPSASLIPNETTYYIYPDLYSDGSEDANLDYFKSSIISLVITSSGRNYSAGDTITFLGGYGTGASATISSITAEGNILGISLNSNGSGYIYTPKIVINTANGTGASVYAIIAPVSGVDISYSYKYAMMGHYEFQLAHNYYPSTNFDYDETIQQVSNKAYVVRYDKFRKILYLRVDTESSDEFSYSTDLVRIKDGTTIPIISGKNISSGWQSTNIPIGSIIRSYKFESNPKFLGSFTNEFGETTVMTTFLNLTTTSTVVDTNSSTIYRSVKYIIQASYNGGYQFSEIVLIHDGTIIDIIEHSLTHTSASPLVTFAAELSGGNMRLMATAAAGSTTNLVIYKCPVVI